MNLLIALSLLLMGHATSATTSGQSRSKLPKITVKGSRPVTLQRGYEIQSGTERIAQALTQLPGYVVTDNGQGQLGLTIKGLDSKYMDIRLNGHRLSELQKAIFLQSSLNAKLSYDSSRASPLGELNAKIEPSRQVQGQIGSYGAQRLQLSNTRGHFGATFVGARARNDFEYNDPFSGSYFGNPQRELRLRNNDYDSQHLAITYKLGRLAIQAQGLSKEQGVPGDVQALQKGIRQDDKLLLLSTQYRYDKSKQVSLSTSVARRELSDPFAELSGEIAPQTEVNLNIQHSWLGSTQFLAIENRTEIAGLRSNSIYDRIEASNLVALEGLVGDDWTPAVNTEIEITQDSTPSKRNSFVTGQLNTKLSWHPSSEWNVSIAPAAKLFAPQMDQLYRQSGLVTANPLLRSERILGIQSEASWSNKRIKLDLRWWRNTIDRKIQYVLAPGLRLRAINIAKALHEGLTLSGRYAPLAFLKLSHEFSLSRSIDKTSGPTYNRALPLTPRYYGRVGLQLHVTDQWNLQLNHHYISKRFVDRLNLQATPSQSWSDVKVSYRFFDDHLASFEIKNIEDTDRFDQRGFPLGGQRVLANYSFSWPDSWM